MPVKLISTRFLSQNGQRPAKINSYQKGKSHSKEFSFRLVKTERSGDSDRYNAVSVLVTSSRVLSGQVSVCGHWSVVGSS